MRHPGVIFKDSNNPACHEAIFLTEELDAYHCTCRCQKLTKLKNKASDYAEALFINLAPRPGLEPGTYGLTVRRSTD